MHNFVIIIENEVVGNLTFQPPVEEMAQQSGAIAIYSSDPRFIPHHEGPIEIGSTWDGSSFTPPVE
jgi:hypothetical protein